MGNERLTGLINTLRLTIGRSSISLLGDTPGNKCCRTSWTNAKRLNTDLVNLCELYSKVYVNTKSDQYLEIVL